MSKNKKFKHLITLLPSFWGFEKAFVWRQLYQNPETTQSMANYLSLNRQLHFGFDKARFALKPLYKTPTTITVQFHWLRKTNLLQRPQYTPAGRRFWTLLSGGFGRWDADGSAGTRGG
jgi:hypothetical protein